MKCANPRCDGYPMIVIGHQHNLGGEIVEFWLCLNCGQETAVGEDTDGIADDETELLPALPSVDAVSDESEPS